MHHNEQETAYRKGSFPFFFLNPHPRTTNALERMCQDVCQTRLGSRAA